MDDVAGTSTLKWIDELEYVRGFAILAVVTIHVTM